MARYVIRYLCNNGIKRILADFDGYGAISITDAVAFVVSHTNESGIAVFSVERLKKCQNSTPKYTEEPKFAIAAAIRRGMTRIRWFLTR